MYKFIKRWFIDLEASFVFFKTRRFVRLRSNKIIATMKIQDMDNMYMHIDADTIKLVKRFNIELNTLTNYSDRGTACLGFSPKTQKWYGWSHRAVRGFKIGDVVKLGDTMATSGYTDEYVEKFPESANRYVLPVGFVATTNDDAKKMAIAFASSVS